MKIRHFLNRVQHDQIHRAIRAAEEGSSGRVTIYISHRRVKDALAEGHEIFRKLNLETPEQKAGLLLFLAPLTQQFAVLGGTALHDKLGQGWWDHLAQVLRENFKDGHYTEGLLSALKDVGHALWTQFPGQHSALPPGQDDLIEEA